MQIGPETIHHVRGVLESVAYQQAQRALRQLPRRRPVADWTPSGLTGQHVEAAGEDLLFLSGVQIADTLVYVTVAADLVSPRDDGRHRLGVMLGDPRGDEERCADLGLAQQVEDAG